MRKVARVEVNREKAIISLVGNVRHSSSILEKAFRALGEVGANVEMISQGASKNNISLVVPMAVAVECVQALHNEFFGNSSANMVPPA